MTIDGNIPLIIGITGHRNISEEKAIVLDKIKSSLLYWIESVHINTPVWILSGLASGADTLALQAALELQRNHKKGKISITGTLPMPREYFHQDFEPNSKEEQDYITLLTHLERNGNSLIVVKNNLSEANYLTAINDLEYGKLRNSLYLNQGLFVAKYCNILISVWNGKTSEGTGGTGDISLYKLGKEVSWPHGCLNSSLIPVSDFDGQMSGIVHHIPCSRLNDNHDSEYQVSVRAVHLRSDCEVKPKYGKVYTYYDLSFDPKYTIADFISREFNQLLSELNMFNQLELKPDEGKAQLLSDDKSAAIFSASDALAKKYQNKYRKQKKSFFFLALTGYLIYELFGSYSSSDYAIIFSFMTLLMLYICWISIRWARKTDYKWKYQLARGVAEGIRIREFLNIADVPPHPSPLIPRRYRTHLPLINQAVLITETNWWKNTQEKGKIEEVKKSGFYHKSNF